MANISTEIPSWNELPFRKGEPVGSAWGLWGDDDELGTLNLLTPERQIAAASLVKQGKSFGLSLPLNRQPSDSFFHRPVADHKILKKGYPAFDDHLVMNTQSSTHWDGLRHFAHITGRDPMEPRFYNNTTADEIVGPNANDRLGIQNLAKHGIVGRGVLLDYKGWCEAQGADEFVGTGHQKAVTVKELEEVAKHQGIKFLPGDILLIRYGWTKGYLKMGTIQKQKWSGQGKDLELIGIENTTAALEWLWNTHFSAIASDSPTFECWPAKDKLHETILGLWGCPIGEFFDLEELAEDCRKDGVYEFLFTSAPIHIIGGVAGPANPLAIK